MSLHYRNHINNGRTDYLCYLCGNAFLGCEEDNKNNKNDWLTNLIMLGSCGNNHIAHQFYDIKNKKIEYNPCFYLNTSDGKENYISIHIDCYNFLYQVTGVKLDYSMIRIDSKTFNDINRYPVIHKYNWQYFDKDALLEDGNDYLMESPTKTNKNGKRIKKVIPSLKLKSGRKGPSISATMEDDNGIRIGNDGNFWQNINGRWNKLNTKPKAINIKCKKINYMETKYIPHICETSMLTRLYYIQKKIKIPNKQIKHLGKPLFIKFISDKEFSLIYSPDFIDEDYIKKLCSKICH